LRLPVCEPMLLKAEVFGSFAGSGDVTARRLHR